MIEWININQGFTLAILTSIYVIATLVIVIIMLISNKLTRKSIQTSLELEKNRLRPYVIFNIVLKKRIVNAEISNIGLTSAKNITLNCLPKLIIRNYKNERETALTRHKIKFLPPNQIISDFIDISAGFFKHYTDPHFKGDISYEDEYGKSYNETFEIDLNCQGDTTYIEEKDVGKELENIGRTLKEVVKVAQKYKQQKPKEWIDVINSQRDFGKQHADILYLPSILETEKIVLDKKS